MTIHVVRCDDLPQQPWRNGGGSTRELLAWPSGADWAVRISVADIERDGPFSAYPGIDRGFAVLEGHGVRLALPGGEVLLGRDDPPLAFAGEDAPLCTLLDGATRDLNLMTRRAAGRGTMRRAGPGVDCAPQGRLRALFAAEALVLQVGDRRMALGARCLAWCDDGGRSAWRIEGDRPRAWWMEFQ